MGTMRTRILGEPVEITVQDSDYRGTCMVTDIKSGNYEQEFYWHKDEPEYREKLTKWTTARFLFYRASDAVANAIGQEPNRFFDRVVDDSCLEDITLAKLAHMAAMDY